MGRTIRKNANRLQDKIFANARDMKLYTLDNQFRGERIKNISNIKRSYQQSRTAYLYHTGSGNYTIHYHSNRFIEFKSIPPPPTKKRK